MIEVKRAAKSYGDHSVIEACSLMVGKGTIYGLAGKNGAGKTTLMKMITGFLEPSDGEVYVKGLPAWENKEKIQKYIGSLIETPIFYEHLSGKENLLLHQAYMKSGGGIEEILQAVGLSGAAGKPVAAYSMGMKQRLAIARALLHEPDILVLDEPLNGLDPLASEDMRRLLREKADRGMTVLISSHILSDIVQLADTVGVLSEKSIGKEFRTEEFRNGGTAAFEQEILQVLRA